MDSNTQQNEILYTVLVAGDVDLSKYDKNLSFPATSTVPREVL